MSTPITGPDGTPPPAKSPPATWLATFSVTVDLPEGADTTTMEGMIAQGLAVYLQGLGLPGNVIVQLMATAGNVTVLTSGAPATVGCGPHVGVTPPIGNPI